MSEGEAARAPAGKTASLGGVPLKFMIDLNIRRPPQHSPGGFSRRPPVGLVARRGPSTAAADLGVCVLSPRTADEQESL